VLTARAFWLRSAGSGPPVTAGPRAAARLARHGCLVRVPEWWISQRDANRRVGNKVVDSEIAISLFDRPTMTGEIQAQRPQPAPRMVAMHPAALMRSENPCL